MILKNLLDCLSRAATFGSNIGAGFLFPILIRSGLKDSLLKFTRTFGFSARVRGVNNVAVNYKRIYSKIPAAINSFLNKY